MTRDATASDWGSYARCFAKVDMANRRAARQWGAKGRLYGQSHRYHHHRQQARAWYRKALRILERLTHA